MKHAAIIWLVATALAAQPQRPPPPSQQPHRGSFSGSFIAPSAQPAPVIALPYAGDFEVRTIQVLPDGTRLERAGIMSRKAFRDSQGRVREEQELGGRLPNGEPNPGIVSVSLVHILDPVDGFFYVIDPVNKVVHRAKAPVSANGRGGPVMMQSTQVPPPAELSARMGSTVEQLGTQIINGVAAEGTRITTTVPVGAIGNDRPLAQSSEIWFAADLKVIVKNVSHNPTGQDSIRELKNVSRVEPDPALFRVPADYQIVDETGRFSINF